MFLSRLPLNPRDRRARTDLARPYEMHRTLWRAFPDAGAGRVLFRVDTDRHGGSPVVLVQSRSLPDWTRVPEGYLTQPADFKPLELQVAVGQRLRFRLRANPTKKVAAENDKLGAVMAGKRVGLTTECEQLDWFLRKGTQGGFRIPGGWLEANDPRSGRPVRLSNFRVNVIPEGRTPNGKPGYAGEFLAVRFEGVLEVTAAPTFVETVAAGIGTAKGYGFGLLSVGPL